ncbi:prepilin peptidase [Hydrogenimonas thermophila]|uniref:prepilin peptidase n=1 Tax=Hydrogenimonas thermophila TaxID=223786 RepID=UPI00293731AA|nr:prepilin peptidase [Hydrogenimonas thermophila]WOE71019.1 prepilin peptidase [Hydrogenimonas thermophila]WOE73537.1 prepilin peptidase [Hydrogenimonas thermophila]
MFYLFAFLIGLAIGSFLNVLIVRIPKNENIVFPASHCPVCNHTLKPWHNIPLLSWLLLKGKCAFCKTPISKMYPMVELITAAIFLFISFKEGISVNWFIISLIFSLLFALSIIDFKYFAVPDSLNFTALALALLLPLFNFAEDYLTQDLKNFTYYQSELITNFKDAAIMALSLFILGLVVKKIIKKDALGEADIIIAATMGALLGFPSVLIAIYTAALLAIIPALFARNHMVPFVPFLALGTLIVYFFNDTFLKWWNLLYA